MFYENFWAALGRKVQRSFPQLKSWYLSGFQDTGLFRFDRSITTVLAFRCIGYSFRMALLDGVLIEVARSIQCEVSTLNETCVNDLRTCLETYFSNISNCSSEDFLTRNHSLHCNGRSWSNEKNRQLHGMATTEGKRNLFPNKNDQWCLRSIRKIAIAVDFNQRMYSIAVLLHRRRWCLISLKCIQRGSRRIL